MKDDLECDIFRATPIKQYLIEGPSVRGLLVE
jgi:hypothetical protein